MNHTTQSRIIHNTIAQLLDLGFEESLSPPLTAWALRERGAELDHDEHLETRNPTFQKTRNKQTHQANISLNNTLPNQDRLARQTKINESQYWKKRRSVARQHQSKNIRSWG